MSISILNTSLNVVGLAIKNKTVAIYKGTQELFDDLLYSVNFLDADVDEKGRLMTHPIEKGSVITDTKVDDPIQIIVNISMPSYNYEKIIKEIKKFFKDAEKLTIKCKGGIYKNMVLEGIPHEERPDTLNNLVYSLSFKEAIEVTSQYVTLPMSKVSNPENSSTINSGEKQTTPITDKTLLARGLDALNF